MTNWHEVIAEMQRIECPKCSGVNIAFIQSEEEWNAWRCGFCRCWMNDLYRQKLYEEDLKEIEYEEYWNSFWSYHSF